MSRLATAAVMVVVATALAACGAAPSQPATNVDPKTGQAAAASSPAGTLTVSAGGSDFGHIHNLALVGDTLLIGSHEGLYEQAVGTPPKLVSGKFDVMGLAVESDRWLASGHPGPGMEGPADLGLLESDDGGQTWSTVSLSGQADFHRLTASRAVVLAVNSGDGMLWRSTDTGRTWRTTGPGPFDVALDPRDPGHVLGTTQAGLIASRDGGRTWTAVPKAPLIALLAWSRQGVWGVAPDGSVFRSKDSGESWTQTGRVPGPGEAVAAGDGRVVALAGDTVWESLDQGVSFEPRVTGLPAHSG